MIRGPISKAVGDPGAPDAQRSQKIDLAHHFFFFSFIIILKSLFAESFHADAGDSTNQLT